MNGFYLLDNDIPPDRRFWLEVWDIFPYKELSAHPDYVKLFARKCDKTLCAVLIKPCGGIVFPFILRPLSKESWVDSYEEYYDAVSPYGYGGVFGWGNPQEEIFWKLFRSWAKEVKLISLFVRLSLFSNQLISFSGKVITLGKNIIRNLEPAKDDIWKDYRQKVRKNVKKAQSHDLKVEVDCDGKRIKDFLSIYYATMARRRAQKNYYFSDNFFNLIIKNLRGHYAFFYVLKKDLVISTELVLLSANNIYSFLGGTLGEAFQYRPNDFLKHEIVKWGKERRKKWYILGGGYEGEDGIYHYKKSFAPGGEVPFKIGTEIYDAKTYEGLLEMRRKFESQKNKSWKPVPGFFPEYRG